MTISQEIILEAIRIKPKNHIELDNIRRAILRAQKTKQAETPNKADLIQAYHKLLQTNKIKKSLELEILLIKKSIRTLSGVTIITVLTKPYPCPGNCTYCPLETQMPKSYLSDEPAAARALSLKFDPYNQVIKRIEMLKRNGHDTDKIELIIKGGTWNFYPENYQYWFILRCFQACNLLKNNKIKPSNKLEKIKLDLKKEQTKNEKAKHRIIGLTIETRPDFINKKTVWALREQGCTRVEMGVQTTDEKILKTIKRGHDVKAVKDATILLRHYGFKIDYHLMPQLPGSTPKKDLEMMLEIFSNPDYRPDMIKVYPCTTIKGSELYELSKTGKYKPYQDKKLVEMLIEFKTKIPCYTRLTRLIRDIPSHHIQAGNKMTNLRQVIQKEMGSRNLKCNCLRCREIGHNLEPKYISQKPKLFVEKYKASTGYEYFLSFENSKREVVYAFCRLYIDKTSPIFQSFIRELHTYGQMLSFGKKDKTASQHKGLGKKLILEVEKIVKKNKVEKLAVISGIGVRGYYRKLGFKLKNSYMVKDL